MLAEGITFDDQAFLQSCKTGLEQARDDFGIECEYNIDTSMSNLVERLEIYGDLDYDLIFAVGYMWNDAVVQTAPKYPETSFVLVDAQLSEAQANTMSVLFDVDEAAYPLGFLAAWWADSHDSETPAVGWVGALEIPQIRQFAEPYLNGVQHFNAEYGGTVADYGVYAGSFIDAELGGWLADSLMTLGADVIFGVGGLTGNGALIAAKERGKWGIGVDVDQSISVPEASDALLSSAMKRLDNAVYAVVQAFLDDEFNAGGIYTGKLANQGVELAPYHDFGSQIPDSIRLAIEDIKTDLIDGSLSTGW